MKKIILIIMCITVTLSVGNVAKCSDKNIKEKSYINTVEMLRVCGSLRKTAGERELTLTTIISHVEKKINEGNSKDL